MGGLELSDFVLTGHDAALSSVVARWPCSMLAPGSLRYQRAAEWCCLLSPLAGLPSGPRAPCGAVARRPVALWHRGTVAQLRSWPNFSRRRPHCQAAAQQRHFLLLQPSALISPECTAVLYLHQPPLFTQRTAAL